MLSANEIGVRLLYVYSKKGHGEVCNELRKQRATKLEQTIILRIPLKASESVDSERFTAELSF